MDKLSQPDQLKSLFSNVDNLDLLLTLNGCCFTVNQSLKSVITAAVKNKTFAGELDSDYAQSAAFLQSALCKELCACYGDKLFVILDLKSKATSPKSSDDSEEDYRKMVNKYNKAIEDKEKLDKIIYQAFINLSEHIQFQMNTLNRLMKDLDSKSFSADEFKQLTEALNNFFARDASLLRSIMLFSLTFCSFEVEVIWLDEIAEGLKHTTSAINSALLNLKRLCQQIAPDLLSSSDGLIAYLQNVLRQVCYTIGKIANRLILGASSHENELSKMVVLSGGIESRFIPGLKDETKL